MEHTYSDDPDPAFEFDGTIFTRMHTSGALSDFVNDKADKLFNTPPMGLRVIPWLRKQGGLADGVWRFPFYIALFMAESESETILTGADLVQALETCVGFTGPMKDPPAV